MARKVIGLITAEPESIYAARIIENVCQRSLAYDYDIAIIAALTNVGLAQENYLAGELNIYNLINFDRLDGILLDSPSLMDSRTLRLIPQVMDLLTEKCNKPVVSLGSHLQEFPSFVPTNRRILQELTEHVIDVHQCRNLYFLAGYEGNSDSIDRINGFKDALAARGIPFDEQQIFYGDFWYSGGTALAWKIISGEVPRPEAVVCASDHLAIGLANRLRENGIRVPEDIIVTGFDATREASINSVTITSAVPDCESVAVRGLDHLRSLMEPGAEIAPYTPDASKHLRLGMSCGCNRDIAQVMNILRGSFYHTTHDFTGGNTTIDIGLLMESNMMEYLSDTASPQECLYQIYLKTYLLSHYEDFYLCLDENWLNTELCTKSGYPKRIHMAIHNTPEHDSGHYENGPSFDTSLMLPDLGEESHEPSIFYFMPVHFLDQSMGYAVLRYKQDEPQQITCVIRNWLKSVNSGLHISRTAHRLESLSTRDGMTGAYNRRGMELMLDQMLRKASPEDNVLAFVIDMDRLKHINDTFGHADGDFGINAIYSAAMSITRDNELCVRAGGDEFYVIGIGTYSPEEAQARITRFYEAISSINASAHKPYQLSASIGSACIPLASGMSVMGIIRIADAKMYENKVQKKMQRKD